MLIKLSTAIINVVSLDLITWLFKKNKSLGTLKQHFKIKY